MSGIGERRLKDIQDLDQPAFEQSFSPFGPMPTEPVELASSAQLPTATAAGVVIRGDKFTSERTQQYPNGVIVSVTVDETLTGTAGDDVIYGGYGANKIFGNNGNDILYGASTGNNSAIGASGLPLSNSVSAFLSSASAFGGAELYGGSGDDRLYGTSLADIIDGGTGNDNLSGGSGDDIFLGSADIDNIDGGEGNDVIRATASNAPIALHDFSSIERITSNGFENVSIVGSASGERWDFSNTVLQGIISIDAGPGQDIVRGSQGADNILAGSEDSIYANDGDDVIKVAGTLSSIYLSGGRGSDTFDFTGVTNMSDARSYTILGDGSDGTFSETDTASIDTLILPGSANNYELKNSFISPSTSFTPIRATQLYAAVGTNPDQFVRVAGLTGIEAVRFAQKMTNVITNGNGASVNNTTAATSILLEQARLIAESYGTLAPLTHKAEALEYPGDASAGAVARGWHRLSALELGMDGWQTRDGVTYAIDGGEYRAVATGTTSALDRAIQDLPESGATILTGIVDGKRTLALTFRGTDQVADISDWLDFSTHYQRYAALIAAIDRYVGDSSNGIQQVLVSGHSLGGGMVQEFMATHRDSSGVAYRALTFGSPGSDNDSRFLADSRILNIGHSSDPVYFVGSGINDDIAKVAVSLVAAAALSAQVALQIALLLATAQDKERQGVDLTIDDSAHALFSLGDHDTNKYIQNLSTTLSYAFDPISPFYNSAIASAFRAGSGSYTGFDLNIAIVAPSAKPTAAIVAGGSRYVLGSIGNDTIYSLNAWGQRIDGGAGTDSVLASVGPLQNPHWERSAHGVELWDGSAFVFEAVRAEKIVAITFGRDLHPNSGQIDAATVNGPSLLIYTGGRDAQVQRLTSGSLDLSVDPAFDYVETAGARNVYGTTGDDILVVSGGSQLIVPGDGADTIVVGTIGINTGETVHIASAGNGDTIVNNNAGGGRLVVDLRYRQEWGIAANPDGTITLYHTAYQDVGDKITLAGNVLVQFAGEAAGAPDTSRKLIFGSDGANVVEAQGPSHIVAGKGDDVIIGSDGADILDGGMGANRLYGGKGDDIYVVDSLSAGVRQDLIFENPGEGIDHVYSGAYITYLYDNIENLSLLASSQGSVVGVGNALDNVIDTPPDTGIFPTLHILLGGGGNDTLFAGAGDDQLFGESGNDKLYGQTGVDYLAGGTGNDMLDGGNGADALYGETGDDTLIGGADFVTDILVGGDGDDIVRGDSGLSDYDRMYGNAGNDIFYVDTGDDLTFEQLGEGTDTVYANVPGANNGVYLYANIENLVLLGTTRFGVGNELANVITGNSTVNLLLGGDGGDRLNGKGGNDVLFGQGGADTFVFEHGTGGDVIGDFAPKTDKIDLTAIGYTWAQVQNAFHQNGSDLAIDLGGGDLVVLNGVNASQLNQSDFILATSPTAVMTIEPIELSAEAPARFHLYLNQWVTLVDL